MCLFRNCSTSLKSIGEKKLGEEVTNDGLLEMIKKNLKTIDTSSKVSFTVLLQIVDVILNTYYGQMHFGFSVGEHLINTAASTTYLVTV